MMQLALYKGPPSDKMHRIGHWLTKTFTASEYSHVELVINGTAYSASSRDGGVRAKQLDLTTGRWDVVEIEGDEAAAKAWFEVHDGQDYDWLGAFRFAIPFLRHRSGKWFCSEAVGAALGLPDAHKLTPQDMWEWSRRV